MFNLYTKLPESLLIIR